MSVLNGYFDVSTYATIQAAQAARETGGGGVVYFPPGSCHLSSTVTVGATNPSAYVSEKILEHYLIERQICIVSRMSSRYGRSPRLGAATSTRIGLIPHSAIRRQRISRKPLKSTVTVISCLKSAYRSGRDVGRFRTVSAAGRPHIQSWGSRKRSPS